RRALRGRSFTFLGRQWHTTSVVTGLLLIGVGVLFWATNGLVTMPQLVPVSVQDWLQQRGSLLSGPVVDIVTIVALALIVLAVWMIRRRRNIRAGAGEPVQEEHKEQEEHEVQEEHEAGQEHASAAHQKQGPR